MNEKRTIEQLKKFQFFLQENIQDDQKNHQLPNLNDIEVQHAIYIEPRLYFSNQNGIFIYDTKPAEKKEDKMTGSAIGQFLPCTRILFIDHNYQATYEFGNYLIVFGIDEENGQYSSYIKFFDAEFLDQQKYSFQKPKKTILIGKPGSPLGMENISSFSISHDFTAMAFGLKNGEIYLYKATKSNLITGDVRDSKIKDASQSINKLFFSRQDESNLNLFFITDESISVYKDLQRTKKIDHQKGGKLYDSTIKGTLIGAANFDDTNISHYDTVKKIGDYTFEGNKTNLLSYKNNYIILTLTTKNAEQCQLIIYDYINNYSAFSQTFSSNVKIIPGRDIIHLIQENKKGDRSVIKLSERDNTYKIEKFFKTSQFDLAYTFAENQNSDKQLLAEISRLHGDHLYAKGDHEQAIVQFIKTINNIEPSYIIRRFLDVAHIDHLIKYLEELHNKRAADKHHTALLLNCYVKQKTIPKLESFLKGTFDYELFDIETAIKVCRELKYNELALRLAEQKKYNEYYLDILIDNLQDYDKALNYIREKVDIEDKVKYILEFGQVLMKHVPDKCIELIQKIVFLQHIAKNVSKWQKMYGTQKPYSMDDQKEKDVFKYLNLNEDSVEKLPSTIFRKPDEFLHLFVTNNEKLENYLVFLTKHIKNLPNEKAIFHRLFEYYLEQYHQTIKEKGEELIYRKTKDFALSHKENNIMDLLRNSDNDKKYDRNHLLVLFKMYNFEPGIIFLCEQMQLREELLNFYISKKKSNEIIELCKKHGDTETNLWVQALKYFIKPDNNQEEKIPQILDLIQHLHQLSPLLILNILSKNQNVTFKVVQQFFQKKLAEDLKQIQADQKIVNENMEKSEQNRIEYKHMKTHAKTFQSNKCALTDMQLQLPAIHFMCGHSYNENVLLEKSVFECPKCCDNQKRFIDTQEQKQQSDTKSFFEKMNNTTNKFDIVAEFLGRGLFKPKQNEEKLE